MNNWSKLKWHIVKSFHCYEIECWSILYLVVLNSNKLVDGVGSVCTLPDNAFSTLTNNDQCLFRSK